MKRKILVMAMVVVCFAMLLCFTALANDISVYVDNEYVRLTDVNGTPVYPFIQNGTTYVPLRGVSQALDCQVGWDGNNKNVLIYKDIQPDSKNFRNRSDDIQVYVDNELVELKDVNGTVVKPILKNGTTYVPVRGVSNALGYYIRWNGQRKSVEIFKDIVPEEGLSLDWVRPKELYSVDAYYESKGQSLLINNRSYFNSLRFSVVLVASKSEFGFNSTALLDLDSKYDYMTFTIGHCDGEFGGYTSFEDEKKMEFIVDGQVVKTYVIEPNSYPTEITVPLNYGLKLKIVSSGDTAMGNIKFYG